MTDEQRMRLWIEQRRERAGRTITVEEFRVFLEPVLVNAPVSLALVRYAVTAAAGEGLASEAIRETVRALAASISQEEASVLQALEEGLARLTPATPPVPRPARRKKDGGTRRWDAHAKRNARAPSLRETLRAHTCILIQSPGPEQFPLLVDLYLWAQAHGLPFLELRKEFARVVRKVLPEEARGSFALAMDAAWQTAIANRTEYTREGRPWLSERLTRQFLQKKNRLFRRRLKKRKHRISAQKQERSS